MTRFTITDEILPADWLNQYKVPTHTVGTGADLFFSNYETVDGKNSRYCSTTAQLVSIEEITCPARRKDFYVWTWRTSKHDSYGGKDAEGNLYSWITLTDTLYREGASLKAFLDKMTEQDYSLTDWQAVGLGTLVAKPYAVVVKPDWYDIVADAPADILGDPPRLHENASRVVSAEMQYGSSVRFAEQVAAATAPPPAPVQAEGATAELDMTTLPVAPVAADTSANENDEW